jgi:ornithine decarboxylase
MDEIGRDIKNKIDNKDRIRDFYHLPPEVDIPGASSRILRQGLARVFLSLGQGGQLAMLRHASDRPILEKVRNQVVDLLDSALLYREAKGSADRAMASMDLVHPKADLESVMREVLSDSSEQSFCFLNEGKLRERMRFLKKYFLPENEWRKITYALKANPKSRIVQILLEEGIDGFDCASGWEAERVLDHSPKTEVYLNNPIKPIDHVERAFGRGVRYFTAQSRGEIERILRVASQDVLPKPVSISVRLSTPNEDAEIDLSDKYGASVEDAANMLKFLDGAPGISRGLAIHTGSQNKNPATFKKGIELMTETARKENGVSSLNVGGGIPVNYHPKDHYDMRVFLETISQSLQDNLQGALIPDGKSEPKIILELGRAIVAEAVDLVIPILSAETRMGERCLYINDGVFTSFSDAVVHHWPYSFETVRRNGDSADSDLPVIASAKTGFEPYRVHGRTCDSGDTLGLVQLPPGLKTGDWLWVRNAGAYLDSQTTYFNGFEPPTYVSYNV